MPDIDSLPPSYSPSRAHSNGTEPHHGPAGSPSHRASTSSLAAAATINASFQQEDSRRSSVSSHRGRPSPQIGRGERRRSSAFLTMNDPTLPGPGELQSSDHRSSMNFPFRTASPQSLGSPIMPHHQRDRAPSLGELHQELEQEQEAQVNRLLEMIRQQQAQLQAIREQTNYTPLGSMTATEDTPPSSFRSSYPQDQPSLPVSIANPRPRSPIPRNSLELSRQSSRRSRTPSRTASPSLRPVSAGLQSAGDEWIFGSGQGARDESAFYQAETQMLTRENQMLRQRIRELGTWFDAGSKKRADSYSAERQLSENNSAATNSPATPSNLAGPSLEVDSTEAVLGSQTGEAEDKED